MSTKGRERECIECGRSFRSIGNRACQKCSATQRECIKCGRTFRGNTRRCLACQATDRVCTGRGRTFRGTQARCSTCWMADLPDATRSARHRRIRNARRARKRAAEVAGPVPRSTYETLASSGPCVYCDAKATTVDHVRPLSRGGAEHEENLVPACKPCNSSKGPKLLTEWRPDRVAHGTERSPIVGAELARLLDMVGVV